MELILDYRIKRAVRRIAALARDLELSAQASAAEDAGRWETSFHDRRIETGIAEICAAESVAVEDLRRAIAPGKWRARLVSLCPGCGDEISPEDLIEIGACPSCAIARAVVLFNRGRCICAPEQRRPMDVANEQRDWKVCSRCLGLIEETRTGGE